MAELEELKRIVTLLKQLILVMAVVNSESQDDAKKKFPK